MSARTKPPFRADHVGSLIRPERLVAARLGREAGAVSEEDLLRIQHDCIREVVKIQEDLGLKVATDGEFNRQSWQTDFLMKIKNIARTESKIRVRFHSKTGTRDSAPPSLSVVGKLSRPNPIFVDDFRFLASVTKSVGKVTLPSPTVVHFRGGRNAIDRQAYPDIEEFYADLARVYREEFAGLVGVGCRYLQIDEVNLAYLCDPALRAEVVNLGEDPASLPKTYARLINSTLTDLPADMTVAMHLCRGNFGGMWVADGGYDPIADMLFNEINVNGYFMEYDSERAGGFEPLRFLPKGKVVVLGLVTTKSPDLETKDDLKRRIEQAAKFAPLDQLALSPQCGFSSGIGGQTMSVDQEIRKLELIIETAREVWGST